MTVARTTAGRASEVGKAAGEDRPSKPAASVRSEKVQDRIGNQALGRLLHAREGQARSGEDPPALTRDGETVISPAVSAHADRERVLAHEAVHRSQFGSAAPRGSRGELESDAARGAAALLRGRAYTPVYSAPPGTILAYGEGAEQWFPDIEQQARREQGALERQGLVDPRNTSRLEFQSEEDPTTGAARARYHVSVSAAGGGGQINSSTTVTLDYEPERRVSVVGPPVIQINPEVGLGPVSDRPAYPYVLTYSRTISYADQDGRTATVEIDGHVFISEATVAARLSGVVNPSYEALLSLLGDSGYVNASVRGSGPITSYYAFYAGQGLSLSAQAQGAVSGLGRGGGLSLIDVSVPATFVDPRMPVGEQYASLRAYLFSADAAELARRLAAPPPSQPSWFDRLTQSLADAVGAVLGPIIDAVDSATDAISRWWHGLPPWARGILTAVGKFAVALAVMAAIAGLIVVAAKGAIAFGAAMLIVGAVALGVGYVMSLVSRLSEAWNSDNRLRVLLAPTIATLDTLGISSIVEAITNESLLTGQPLNRTEEEQWEAGTTGVLQLVGIFLMVRGMRSGPSGRAVGPEVRGPMQDFHALPAERLPVLPEGHYWVRQGPEWILYREPGAPEVPIEISIYSDGQGSINYNVRSGSRVLQSEAMTRPQGDTYSGGENRLPPELRGTGPDNPYIEDVPGGRTFEKGHGIDYVDRIEGPGVRSSNADVANFTPQARYWNSFLRNHLVRQIRSRGGGYREMPVYEQTPNLTVNETPIPAEFVFVETSPTGQAIAAWRIPNDPAINTRQMSQLPQYSIPLSQIPRVMIETGTQMRPPGAIGGPFAFISGQRGEEEEQ